ncbi:MAG: ribosome maturation factor RimM [Sandaracinaceae bacterium]
MSEPPDSESTGAEGDPDELVAIAAIARPHGVMGELRVHRFNPDSRLLLDAAQVWLRKDGETVPHVVKRARVHHAQVLVTLEGTVGREAAEGLRGYEVCLPRSAFPPPNDDEFYFIDMLGASVVSESGRTLGKVAEVLHYPSVDCLRVEEPDGDREIPLVEPYIVDIDLEAGRVLVRHEDDFELQRRKKRR